MIWTSEHDLILCKEILFVNPYSAKKKSVQRSVLWQQIAENVNSIQSPRFIVEKRSVRDHIGILVQRFKRKEASELRESGTTPERTELDDAIEQIIAMEESADTEQQEIDDERKEKLEGDRKKAEDVRKKAMEKVGQTQRRKSDQEGSSQAKKSRRSGSETVEFLKLKAEQDRALKTEELEIKRQENQHIAQFQSQQAQMLKNMVEQQQQQQKQMQDMQNLLLLQQQQQTQALMTIIAKLVPK